MIRFGLRRLVCCVAVSVILFPVVSSAGEENAGPNDQSVEAATVPTAFLENAQTVATGKEIKVFRVPTRDSNGKIKYYDLRIPLTVRTDGTIGTTAAVKSSLSPTLLSNAFVGGTYTDNDGDDVATCTVATSVLKGGRTEVSLTCKTASGENLSASWATGPISGHPFELDLTAAGIDKISGASNYAWGKMGSADYEFWGYCFDDRGAIISARQVANTISISCYGAGNIQREGVNIIKK